MKGVRDGDGTGALTRMRVSLVKREKMREMTMPMLTAGRRRRRRKGIQLALTGVGSV